MALTRTRTLRAVATALTGLLTVGIVVTVLPPAASAAPARPATPPTSASVRAQIDQLDRKKEALTETYNVMQADVQAKQKAAAAAQHAATQAHADFVTARRQLTQVVTARYEGASFSAAGALLAGSRTTNYLSQLSQLALLSAHRGDLVAQLNAAKAKADAAQQRASTLLSQANAKLADVVKQRDAILSETKKFQDLLAKLTAQELAAYRAAHTPPAPQVRAALAPAAAPTPPPAAPQQQQSTVVPGQMTAAQKKIVDYVVAQVGGCYTFAGVGNPCYDCSGLSMMAYQQVGISLPHNALLQYNFGTHVSSSELQPGDLVFLYQPIGHVEIYIGNGVAVSAANEALGIRYVNVFDDMADYTGATRLL